MKKLHLLLSALLAAGSASAQYYQHTYGLPSNEVLESGVNTIAPAGKLMTGFSDFGVPGQNVVVLTRTTPAGVVGPVPTFNNAYFLIDPNTGAQLNAQARRVVELNTGNIAVWGDYSDVIGGLPNRFFYMETTPNGVVIGINFYILPVLPVEVQATSMIESTSTPGIVFVSGFSIDAAGVRRPVLMSLVAAGGGIIWSWEYQDNTNPASEWVAWDLEESPFPTTTGIPDIGIVGRYSPNVGGIGDGCFFTVDHNTGFITNGLTLYGTAANEESLGGICVANNPMGSGPGFAVSGTAFNNVIIPNSMSTWAMKINPAGNIVNWSSLIDYSIAGTDESGFDIIERVNMAGAFEYYVGGMVIGGVFGGTDAVVNKLNAGGGPVFPNQFTYGGPGNEDARQLGQENAAPLGLSTFGNTNGSFAIAPGGPDFYLVKSYFNGVNPCNTNRVRSPFFAGPGIINTINVNVLNNLTNGQLIHQPAVLNDVNICFAAAVIGGNNARVAPLVSGGSELYPNPVSADQALVNISFAEGAEAGEVRIELRNMLGQICMQRTVTMAEGQTSLQIDLGSGLSSGIYHLTVREGEEFTDYKISVQ